MQPRYIALPFVLCIAACTTDDGPSQPSPVADANEEPNEGGRANDAADARESCSPPPDASLCAFKAGALVSETLGTCAPTGKRIPVEHIILLMQENRSFDHYLGHLKGNGQDDVDVPAEGTTNPSADDAGAPVAWHHLDEYCFEDTDHEWEGSHLEWNQGKNDGFVRANVLAADGGIDISGSRAMGYYDQRDIPFYYQLASTFSISDTYFCELLGPTFPNRLYYLASSSFGLVANRFDQMNRRSIFTVLNERQISWKIYLSDVPLGFVLHAFSSESQVPNAGLDGSAADKLAPISQFAVDAAAGTLPQVAWVDPQFITGRATQTSEHPPGDIQVGQKFVYDQVHALLNSPSWSSSVMFITYDEHGGIFDHVAPPKACAPDDIPPETGAQLGGFDQYGFRVPVYVVSPFAKRHFVSHVTHSHSSILRFLEAKFDLPALSNRDANSDAMFDMFDFDNPPFATAPTLDEPAVDTAHLDACKTKFGP